MPEIISAKCNGCGNIIKVPAALGGKKARCPQCTNTIVIPTAPSDTQFTEFISDAELPEVAKAGEKVMPEEGDAPIPGQEDESEEDPSEVRRSKGGTSVRGRNVRPAAPPSNQRSGPQPRVYAGGGGPAARPAPAGGGNTGMIIGIGLAVVALVIAAVFFAGGNNNSSSSPKSGTKAPKDKEKDKEVQKTKGPQYSDAEQALIARLMDYIAAVNRGDIDQIVRFYAFEPDDLRKMRIQVAQNLVDKKVTYENVQVKSVNIAGGTITFTHNGGEKTLTWKQVNDVWLIAEMPSP